MWNEPHLRYKATLSPKYLHRLCVLLFLTLLLNVPASAASNRYPPQVYQATYLLSLFQESRHLRLIHECIQREDQALVQQAHAGDALKRHGFRKIKSVKELDQGQSILAIVKGEPYVISQAKGQAAVSRFVEALLVHPRFSKLYKKYVSRLELHERIAVGALELAYKKPELLRTLGVRFVQKNIVKLSRKNLSLLSGERSQ